MFRTTRYIKSLIIVAAAVAAACTADPVDTAGTEPQEEAEPASLTIDFSIADLGIDVSTRTETSEGTSETFTLGEKLDPDHPERMDNEAAFIDGRKMTCLTVLLVHRPSNKIVGVRRIPDPNCPNRKPQEDPNNPKQPDPNNAILNDDGTVGEVLKGPDGKPLLDGQNRIEKVVGTKARVTFNYDAPVHKVDEKVINDYVGSQKNLTDAEKKNLKAELTKQYDGKSAECLVRGRYTILAVANYDHSVTTSATSNNDQTLNVDRTLEDIVDSFHDPKNMAEGLGPFAPDATSTGYQYFYNVRFLMNHTLGNHRTDAGYDLFDVVHHLRKNIRLTSGQLTGEAEFCPYIRPAVHQTLSVAKDFYLGAGQNELKLELQRISSRTRVEVRNYIPTALAEGSTTTVNDKLKLQVNELSFSKNYTQSTCYLFRREDDRNYAELATKSTSEGDGYKYNDHDGKGAPVVEFKEVINNTGILHPTTQGAIVPFVAENNFVNANEKKCIFDAFMYESSLKYKDEGEPADDPDPDSFTYTIDVSYPNITDYKTPDINKIDINKAYSTEYDPDRATLEYAKLNDSGHKDYIHNPASAQDFCNSITTIENTLNKTPEGGTENRGESLCFLIQSVAKLHEYYLYEKEDGTLFADRKEDVELTTGDIDIKSYLWVLEDLVKDTDGNYYCYLKNLRTGKYMPEIPVTPADKNVNDSNCMKSTTKSLTKKFKLGVNNTDYHDNVLEEYSVTFSSSHNNTSYYLSVWSEGPYLSGYNKADQGCQYRLYPVKILPTKVYVGTPRIRKENIELTAFSDETAVVEKVTEIRRNDFIRILVEVSYNPDASEFEFEVSSWKEGGGNVDFH